MVKTMLFTPTSWITRLGTFTLQTSSFDFYFDIDTPRHFVILFLWLAFTDTFIFNQRPGSLSLRQQSFFITTTTDASFGYEAREADTNRSRNNFTCYNGLFS